MRAHLRKGTSLVVLMNSNTGQNMFCLNFIEFHFFNNYELSFSRKFCYKRCDHIMLCFKDIVHFLPTIDMPFF